MELQRADIAFENALCAIARCVIRFVCKCPWMHERRQHLRFAVSHVKEKYHLNDENPSSLSFPFSLLLLIKHKSKAHGLLTLNSSLFKLSYFGHGAGTTLGPLCSLQDRDEASHPVVVECCSTMRRRVVNPSVIGHAYEGPASKSQEWPRGEDTQL